MGGFDDTLERALDILRRRGVVSYDALRRQFDIAEDELIALRRELVEILGAAEDDRERQVLTFAGRSSPGPAISHPHAERRQLTVLSCDLVGSTALSMRLDPEDLREVMHVYQTVCARTIERLGGHVQTWQGDGVFVLFGYPRTGEDDAARAVRCAWEILQALAPARERFKREHGIRFAVRIGVHTGTTVVGDEGVTSPWQTLAFGGTPNIAARVGAAAEPDTVAVSGATRRLASGYFDFQPLGKFDLKGVPGALELYRLTGPGQARHRFDVSLRRGLTPFVGRAPQRARLADAVSQVLGGRLKAVLITGEPGIGKSRLVHLVAEENAGRLQADTCECSPYWRGTALHPIIETLRRRWTIKGAAGAQSDALRAGLDSHPAFADPRNRALLSGLFDLPKPPDTPLLGSPQRQRAETLELLLSLLRDEARRRPLLLAIEDLQWVDPSTSEFISGLLTGEQGVPLLLLLTARPEFKVPWATNSGLEVLALDRLSVPESRELTRGVASAAQLSAKVIERLGAQTDGVPLFVEEMTRAVLDAGAGGVSGLEHGEETIPTTLYGCLMGRLDRDPGTLEVAQVAATIGRRFDLELLRLVCGVDDTMLEECLARLAEAQLVEPIAGEHGRYAFRHALIQETALSSMLRATRQERHARIADTVIERFPQLAEDQPEVLAQHLEHGGRIAEAVVQWMRAGQREVQRSSNAEAIIQLEHALGLLVRLPDDAERARLELPLRVLAAVPLTLTRGWTAPEVEAHYRRARELCHRVGDTPELFPTLVGLVTYLIVSGQLEEARTMGEADLVLARAQNNPEYELEAELDLGNTLFYMGRPREALGHLLHVDELYEPERFRVHAFSYGKEPAAIARLHQALALWTLGQPDSAMDRMRSAEALIQEWPHPFTDAWIHTGAAVLRILRGEVAAARQHADTAITISLVEGFPNWLAQANVYRGWTLVAEGDQGGLAQMEEGLNLWSVTGAQLMIAFLRCMLADAQARCGRYEDALATLDGGIEHAQRSGDCWYEPELVRLSAEIALKAGKQTPEQAAVRLRSAVTLAARRSQLMLELRAATSLARISNDDANKAALRGCYLRFEEGHATVDMTAARSLIDGAGNAVMAS